jgi:hypothetical protein
MADKIKGLEGKVAKQAQTIAFLLKRVETLKGLLREEIQKNAD